LIREGLPQLLNDSSGAGVTGDIEVQNLATAMTDDEEAIEHTERDGGYRKEVHGGDRFTMVSQKSKPPFGWFGISGRSAHPAGDGPLGNIDAQHQKFTVNTRCGHRGVPGAPLPANSE